MRESAAALGLQLDADELLLCTRSIAKAVERASVCEHIGFQGDFRQRCMHAHAHTALIISRETPLQLLHRGKRDNCKVALMRARPI